MGRVSPVQSEMYYNNPYQGSYGPFMPRQPQVFSDGAFGPMSPIQPVPIDQPPEGGAYPDPRFFPYTPGWNLPTPPGTEGLKLASFDQLKTLADKYSVARACIDLRQEEIRGLTWEITMTKEAAKAYQGSHRQMKDFGARAAEATAFFKHPDKGYWNFDSFLNALLEEIFVYDAMCLIFRPKYGASFGMGGKGLLGSNLDSIRLVPGPTIRPLVDLHGDPPLPPNPAYQQFLYGVPRSDYKTIMYDWDLEAFGMDGDQVAEYRSDMMLYAPYWPRRESPYGFPPVERALLPIVSGLQKQEFQLDYFKEGSVPAVYISPGDPNITPTQIKELQDALNGVAGDPAFHLKVVVLPPGSKVDPQRPVDLSDSFDLLVQTQVCMAFDVQPIELGILPNIGGESGNQGPSSGAVRLGSQEARDIKSRKSTKPLLKFIADVFNMVLQDICGQRDMRFQFEGLSDDEDKQAITELGVSQVQNGIASIDEVRDRLDLPPWGLKETSEPVVFTAQGPIPFSMAPQLIMAAQQGANGGGGNSSSGSGGKAQGTNSGQRSSQSRSRTNQPSIRQGGQTKPNGSHKAPVSPHRESVTPAHSAAAGAIQSSTPRTGGTTSRSSVAGSRKKAVMAELGALKRHLRKDRNSVFTWEPRHIDSMLLAKIADDINSGVLIDIAMDKAERSIFDEHNLELVHPAADLGMDYDNGGYLPPVGVTQPAEDFFGMDYGNGRAFPIGVTVVENKTDEQVLVKTASEWPGWEHDLGLVGAYKQQVAHAFKTAESKAGEIRKEVASGKMFIDNATLRGLITEEVHDTFLDVLEPLWTEAWNLGYEAAVSLVTGKAADFSEAHSNSSALQDFIQTEGTHWIQQISRTGLNRADARAEVIARTEVARAMNAGAIQAYRTNGVTHKHLLVAPDDLCDVCKTAEDEGIIPLDSIFPGGGLGGPFHPQCRCVPAPASIDGITPPQAHIGKSDSEDNSRAAFLMIRSPHPEDGKYRYLLQQRDKDGSWGLPGGGAHMGEDPYANACRETQEEIGDIPKLDLKVTLAHQKDDKLIHIFLVEAPWFTPKMNGETAYETHGYGWFKKKQIKDLDLHPHFRKQWESIDWGKVDKSIASTENGEMLETRPEAGALFPAGARWPYPRRSDGAEDPHYGTAETDAFPSRDPSRNTLPAAAEPKDNMWDGPSSQDYEPDETTEFPRKRTRNRGPKKNPSQGPPMPQNTNGGTNGDGTSPGADTGIPPSGDSFTKMYTDMITGRASPRPAVGSVPAKTPKPMNPDSVPPEVYDPAESVATEENGEIAYYPAPPKRKGGPSDYRDANPVDAEHVYVQMAKNFPPDAIDWIKRAKWTGPHWVPWDRVDTDDEESWAASHEPGKVDEFAKQIAAHNGHVAPSVLVQHPDNQKAFIVDGHHRALARRKLNQNVLGYVGNIDAKDRMKALETHSHQIHHGSDPENK